MSVGGVLLLECHRRRRHLYGSSGWVEFAEPSCRVRRSGVKSASEVERQHERC